jgi:hypothetical protein
LAVTALRPMPKFQAFDLNGDPLAGGKLYTYSAGTTTALATYTDSTGVTANANPVILDSRGEASVWFQPLNYKLVLKDSSDNTIWTQDNYSGSPFPITDEWITYVHTWTYISATQVSVPGDQTAIYTVNKAIRAVTTGGTYYGTITASAYDGSTKTTLTVSFDTGSFDSGVSGSSTISIGVQSTQSPALTFAQTAINAPGTSATSTTSLTIGTGSKSLTVQTAKSFVVGMSVKIAYTNSPTNWMHGDITAYDTSTGALTVNVTTINGSGTQTAWTVSLSGIAATAGVSSVTSTSGSANITLTAGSNGYQSVTMTAMGKHISLPDATGMTVGGPRFILKNDGGYPFGIRDNAGTLIMAVAAGGIAYVTLKDNSTAAGSWSVIGDNLEPGLITIDSTFSSTYASTVLAPFVALDSNTSIHFAALSSGFAAFVVDNTGKVLTTPVTVSSAASSVPKAAFKVSATSAIVFFGASTTDHQAVVLTLSGSTPSFSLAVGTPQAHVATLSAAWDGENFSGSPKIAQLSSTLYLWSFVNGTTMQTVAVSVAGATVSIGTAASAGTASCVAASTTTYALTATTALVLYNSGGGAPYAVNAVVVSVSGTTCTVGTPAAAATGATTGGVPSSCLLSSTKAIVIVPQNAGDQPQAHAITISGTSVSWGAALNVEGSTVLSLYTSSSATRYNPHLFPLTTSTALLWYLDSSGISRAVVLSESGGTVTAGTIMYRSISIAASGSAGAGTVAPQGTTEFFSIMQSTATSAGAGLQAIAHKVSGTTITNGAVAPLRNLVPCEPINQRGTRLESGDYVFASSSVSTGNPVAAVLRSNGDAINYRGEVKIPQISGASGYHPAKAASNRVVILGSTEGGTTVSSSTKHLRLLNLEIAA